MYFILYSTGAVEMVKEVDKTLERLIETGVINFILDIKKQTIKHNTDKGVIDTPVPVIT